MNTIKLLNTLAILQGTSGNFRPLSLTTSAFVNLYINLPTITDFERALSWTLNKILYQLVNTIKLMNTLAILGGTFGNFRPLSLTTSACVNLHAYILTVTDFEGALTFDRYLLLLRLSSIFIWTYHYWLRTRAIVTLNKSLYQLVNTIKWMNTLAILRGTFDNFRPLSLTSSACVNLHIKCC